MESLDVGDMTVYPGQGVAEVTAIDSREIGGISQAFYVLRVVNNGMEILVPTKNVRGVGLREVIDQTQVAKAMKIFAEHKASVTSATWNRRYREYVDKLKTGAVLEVAVVLRDLSLVRSKKELSFGERRLLDTARAVFIREMAVATNQDVADVEEQIDELLPVPLQNLFSDAVKDAGEQTSV